MKKIFLSLAIAITASNLTIAIGYAAVRQSIKGARACGTTCATNPDGTCACTGECTAEERAWVAKAPGVRPGAN
jgi:hypothetical protein